MRLKLSNNRRWRRPPWAVLIVAILHIVVSIVLLVSLIPETPAVVDANCVFDCGAQFVDSWGLGSAPYWVLFALTTLVSAAATVLGSSIGRTVLLVTVVAFTCFLLVWEVSGTVEVMLPAGERDVGLLGALRVWYAHGWLPAWLVVALWLALTFWSLCGPPAAGFYAKNA